MYKDITKTDWNFSDNANSTSLEMIYKKFANIVSVEKTNKSDDKVSAIVKNNYEDKSGNSSLLIFDVRHIINLNSDIVVYQFGYELNDQKIITQTNTRKMKY